MSPFTLSIIRIVIAVYVGLCLILLFTQSRQVYVPDRVVEFTPASLDMTYTDISMTTEDGQTITGWFVPAPQGEPADTVLFCHGNGGNIGNNIEPVHAFHKLGCNVLVFDYRGYGRSSGKPSEKGTYTDAYTAWNYLTKQQGVPPEKIIIFGQSLGGPIAAWLTQKVSPKMLVIESTFTSAPDMAAKMFPLLPARFLCRYKYDTRSYLKSIKCPVLIAHSTQDEMIPFSHGKRLFEAANNPKRFIQMTGNHNNTGIDIDTAYQKIFSEMMRAIPASSKTESAAN